MYFRLSDDIALRGWEFIPRAFYRKNTPFATGLPELAFEFLILCDGEHDLPDSELSRWLTAQGLILPCRQGEHPDPHSLYRKHDNRYFPKMNLMITGKCNYNCLHCFNAADNDPLTTQWDFAELCRLLDEAETCGVHAFTITGGEPMLYPHFMELLRAIVDRGMLVDELNTNGAFLTRETLDEMKAIGCRPLMKISFDGLGCHSRMRNVRNAEERTLAAIALCVQNGFPVMVQTQVNRMTVHSLLPTAKQLAELGVDEIRLIRTTETSRWAINANGLSMPPEEYYTEMLAFARAYAASGLSPKIDIWQFLRLLPAEHAFEIVPVMCSEGRYKDSIPVCKCWRGMIGVTSEGEIIPCLQASGFFMEHGIHMPNLHKASLKDALRDPAYTDDVFMTLGALKSANRKCAECRWFKYCGGGCRALGCMYSDGSFTGEDISKCIFFENGWYDRIASAFPGWHNLSPVSDERA